MTTRTDRAADLAERDAQKPGRRGRKTGNPVDDRRAAAERKPEPKKPELPTASAGDHPEHLCPSDA